jgi:hypothetical protein
LAEEFQMQEPDRPRVRMVTRVQPGEAETLLAAMALATANRMGIVLPANLTKSQLAMAGKMILEMEQEPTPKP